jgi:hypothetical protein
MDHRDLIDANETNYKSFYVMPHDWTFLEYKYR